jgi:hypothetical protein
MDNSNFTKVIRSSAILTNSYVAATVLGGGKDEGRVAEYNQLAAYFYYTKGSLTSLEVKIESSLDGTNYVQETNIAVSGATITMNKGEFTTTEDGNFKITMPMSAKFVKISAKGTGTLTSSLLGIEAMLQYV